MKTLGKLVIVLLALCGVLAIIAGVVVRALPSNPVEQAQGGNNSVPAVDLIGTTSGTSTTPVSLGLGLSGSGTVSSTAVVGEETNLLSLNLKFTTASTTAASSWRVQKSNDDQCNTTNDLNAATNTIRSDIRWYDVPNSSASGAVTTYGAGATTYTYIPGGNQGITQQFSNWNARCIKVIMTSVSSSVYVQLKTSLLGN